MKNIYFNTVNHFLMAVENKTFQGVYASFCLCPSSQNYVKIDIESGEKMLCTQKMSSKSATAGQSKI